MFQIYKERGLLKQLTITSCREESEMSNPRVYDKYTRSDTSEYKKWDVHKKSLI